MIKIFNKIIEYSFYAIFFFIPFIFTSDNSELFELSKMWFTFGMAILIGFVWVSKSIIQREFRIQRTPLDIPITLFLLSQIISTIFSLDTHVSIWGYYSRFNGGLLSILTYVFLYYAFVSNLTKNTNIENYEKHENNIRDFRKDIRDFREIDAIKMVKRLLLISLVSGLVVALWGLPSHFGYDPTCLLFRGTLDVSCWTDAFQPKVRIFSTLGQPDWLAAYLAVLIPVAFAFMLNNKEQKTENKEPQNSKLIPILYSLLAVLFYLDLTFTDARSGFVAIWGAIGVFTAMYVWTIRKRLREPISKLIRKNFIILFALFSFFLIFFFAGTPVYQLDRFTFHGIKNSMITRQENKPPAENRPQTEKSVQKISGGTESTQIRFIVWEGAIEAWKKQPIFGSGVETFAFAYYKNRLPAHNLTSEWDFLYNKAHNEYINYLATTGVLGLGSYLLMICIFLWLALTKITKTNKNHENNSHDIRDFRKSFRDFRKGNIIESHQNHLLIIGLISGYISILITNFFGFSVVMTNIYLFMIPAFVFILNNSLNFKNVILFGGQQNQQSQNFQGRTKEETSLWQMLFVFIAGFISLYLLFNLFKFWLADKAYALGFNYDRAGQYQEAYSKLHEAVSSRGDEPVFKDELAINAAVLSAAYTSQKEETTGKNLENEALFTTNFVTSNHPNNVVFQKTKVRVFYTLAQVNPQYLPLALETIIKAHTLAPTDAKISYNLGLLYAQNGNNQKAVETLENTVKLKPDYHEAYYALGLYYRELAIDKSSRVVNPEYQKKAVETMKFILNNFGENPQAQQSLKNWGEF